jgi:CheY-like chemotaxis protein
VAGDPNRLRQLLLNYLQNAVKFTKTGGIHLKVTRLLDDCQGRIMIKFVVADTGIGISPEHCQHIFQKYQQADASVARNYGGTGLGLAICKILVETLGGTIGVNSTVGKGSQFWFVLPYGLASSGAVSTTTVDSQTLSCGHAMHILIAEDNKVNQKLLVALLNRLGHRATVVETGLQAVHAVEQENFDVVLMDVQMPEMDGLEATQIIRKMGYTLDALPILGLTADFRTADRAHYQSIGMNDCLGKPIRMKDLRTYLINVIVKQ